MRTIARVSVVWLIFTLVAAGQAQPAKARPRRNVIVFIADGLRHGSVNEKDTPALWQVRTQGVHFRNSYSLFPTFTTANASAIATGHALGDTGDFSNTIWVGYATFDTKNYGNTPGTPLPFIENDQQIGDLDSHFGGNYLGEMTLLAMARAHGYNTAAIGKLGPTAIQDAAAIAPVDGKAPASPATIVIDDATGSTAGVPVPQRLLDELGKANLPAKAPAQKNPNVEQQQWMADIATRAILPMFQADSKPFALVYWSRDPDASQHNEKDSLNKLEPGINGETAIAGIRNADHNLRQILDWLDAHPEIKKSTDIFVTSDHGFATVARRTLDASGTTSTAQSASHPYRDTEKGTLPPGFVAIDLALALKTKLWDSDRRGEGGAPFREVRLDGDTWEHPQRGSGLLGERVPKPDGSDAAAIVAANGGSDLIYVPDGSAPTVRKIVDALLAQDYSGAIFVDDRYQPVAGTLPLKAINLVGSTALPRPAIVVALKTFYLRADDLQSGIQLSDSSLQEGQGMHGGFGRDQTYNNMAAFGPDFKKGYVDDAPVSNADIVPTLARVAGFETSPKGKLQGRVAKEALSGGAAARKTELKKSTSQPSHGRKTVLKYEEFDGRRYVHSATLEPER